MTKKRKKSRREVDIFKDEILETAKKVVDQSLPLVSEGITNILSKFTKSMEERIREGIKRKLDGKKFRNKKEGKPDVNPQ